MNYGYRTYILVKDGKAMKSGAGVYSTVFWPFALHVANISLIPSIPNSARSNF